MRVLHRGLLMVTALFLFTLVGVVTAEDRPNILWITNEDISPDLGCYGVDYAETPQLDALARRGVRYSHAFATSGVCAPARSCLITGVYPSSLGSHHMRSQGDRPEWMHQYPWYLRQAGYYTTNNSKTDYNMPVEAGAWDENSRQAHYRNRQPGQPFFAIFNLTMTHESALHKYDSVQHDPAAAPLPAYHPDTPEVRQDWARYHDRISEFDERVGQLLAELETEGVADDTIVFYYSDHGAGMARGKRWLYDSGIHVPLIIYFPEKYRHLAPSLPGSVSSRLVSFVDFAPTLLSLVKIDIPDHMQGRAFLGSQATRPRQYVYALRGRMDERYDMQRAVRDARYKYIRNYMPHKTYALHLEYMYRTRTMQTWQRMHDEGLLNSIQDFFFTQQRPVEELYDTQADPDEVFNLASSPKHQETLLRMRQAHLDWVERTLDVGFLAEPQIKTLPRQHGFTSAYEWARSADAEFNIHALLNVAWETASDPQTVSRLLDRLQDDDPAVRHWAAMQLNARAPQLAQRCLEPLTAALEDADPSVAIEAAQALTQMGQADQAIPRLAEYLRHDNEHVALAAAIALDESDWLALPALEAAREAAARGGYVQRVLDYMISQLD